jgi:phosphoglycerol transferase MdoB-like AlkP superfamily enzyme
MSLFRGVFFFYFGKGIDFAGLSKDILKAFFMGFRYDLTVVSEMSALITLTVVVLMFVDKKEILIKFLSVAKWYYAFFASLIFVFLCVDFGFYSYFQNHINILIFGFFEDDTKALISTIYENYNVFLIFSGFILIFVLTFAISKKILQGHIFKNFSVLEKNLKPEPIHIRNYSPNIALKISIAIFLLAFNFLCARGTIRNVPLEVDDADVSQNMFINKVAINGFFTFMAAITARNRESKGIDLVTTSGFKDARQAFADFFEKNIDEIPENPQNVLINKTSFNQTIEEIKPNVILIVMESFGSDLLKYNSEQFNLLVELKKHFDQDFVFYNYLPGGGGTMVSLETIALNLARRPISMVLSQSQFAYKKYPFSAPTPYNKNNYETAFIYGGGIGWRNAGVFMSNVGFQKVIGAGSMNPEYPRNQWGVYDEHLLDFVFNYLNQGGKSKFILVMTTTNHPPYSIPKDYQNLPLDVPPELENRLLDKDLGNKRFVVYQYANNAVGNFITRIKNSKFADNTIIALTGDHNFWGLFEFPTQDFFNSQKVPFYIYVPKKICPKNVNVSVFGSHPDIMPTLYNLSLSDVEYMSMGINLLSQDAENNIAFNGGDLIADKTCVVRYNFLGKNASYFLWDKNTRSKLIHWQTPTENHKRLIKHFIAQNAVVDYLLKNTGTNATEKNNTR